MMPPLEISTTPCPMHDVPPKSEPRERPILFSEPMVRALLAGSKTQTRRVAKAALLEDGSEFRDDDGWPLRYDEGTHTELRAASPYGLPGDRLWVREAWRTVAGADDIPPRDLMNVEAFTHYEADSANPAGMGKLRPGMFMPRWASRILLEVTGVRVERLQDISEADARAEGIEERANAGRDPARWRVYGHADRYTSDPVESYRSLWESINGAGSWDPNIWVWVVEFRRITP